MRVQVGDVRLYFDVAGMGLVPDGPGMRQRPVVVCLHGGPGLDHSMLKAYLAPLAAEQIAGPGERISAGSARS